MYSGQVEVEPNEKWLHYVFTESQGDWKTDPLILWTNGGPACSSLIGFVSEIGPFQINSTNQFEVNKYAWNRNASVIYLEHPATVGFSKCIEGGTNCSFTDVTDSAYNHAFIKGWMEKFPEYENHTLYLAGESYAGVYVPLMAWRIVDGNKGRVTPNPI
jgi:carboxypeptidase C (cathepsin A)